MTTHTYYHAPIIEKYFSPASNLLYRGRPFLFVHNILVQPPANENPYEEAEEQAAESSSSEEEVDHDDASEEDSEEYHENEEQPDEEVEFSGEGLGAEAEDAANVDGDRLIKEAGVVITT